MTQDRPALRAAGAQETETGAAGARGEWEVCARVRD